MSSSFSLYTVITTLFFMHFFCESKAQAFSQLSQEVQSIIKSKSTFREMTEAVENYYNQHPKGRKDRSYKFWARWANQMSYYTDDEGLLGDIDGKNIKAAKAFKTKSGSRSSTGDWQNIGPSTIIHPLGSAIGIGRADRIAFHPTNINIVYVGTSSGGLWKTTNGGNTWTPMTDALPTTGISGIVVSHDDPDNKIFILTGDGDSSDRGVPGASGFKNRSTGVYVSYDAGLHWENLPLPIITTFYGYNLRQSPTNANILLAATTQGIYRTSNGGNTWTQVQFHNCYDIEFKPGSGTIVYAASYEDVFDDSRFLKSTDGGQTWVNIVEFNGDQFKIQNSERMEIAVSNNNPELVYLLTGNSHPNEDGCTGVNTQYFNGFYMSLNSGTTFSRVDGGNINLNSNCCDGSDYREQSTLDIALAANHNAQNTVVAGGIITWRSTTFGTSWSPAYVDDDPNGQCGGTGIGGFIHGDIHQLAYQPGSNRLWACTDGGVYYSDNNGLSWQNKCSGLIAGQAYHLGVSNVNAGAIMIGQQDNGVRSRIGNTSTWQYVVGADGYDCQYKWNSQTSGFFSVNGGVYEFFNNGTSLTNIDPVDDLFLKRVCNPINNAQVLYTGDTIIRKYQKIDGSWTNVDSYDVSGYHDIERCPSNANRFYFAGGESYFSIDGSLRRTDNNFTSWTTVLASHTQRISDIAVRPNNSDVVWYCLGGYSDTMKVFKSTDEGVSWDNMTDNLPNVPCFSLAIDDNGDAYVGTQLGVFYRTTTMSEWIPFNHQLPKMPVTDLEISQGKIIAATYGRGIWESDLYSVCGTSISITSDITGTQLIEKSQLITATNKIYGGASSDVVYKSGNEIRLLPGFHAPALNNLKAYTKPCGEW